MIAFLLQELCLLPTIFCSNLSDDTIQDHVFVKQTLDKMLAHVYHIESCIIIERGNCTAQYKCVALILKNCRKLLVRVINVKLFTVMAYLVKKKWEVKHVGLIKIAT